MYKLEANPFTSKLLDVQPKHCSLVSQDQLCCICCSKLSFHYIDIASNANVVRSTHSEKVSENINYIHKLISCTNRQLSSKLSALTPPAGILVLVPLLIVL